MVKIAQYFLRKSSTNYVLLDFNINREGISAVDQVPFKITKSNGANISIGDDVSIGYMVGAAFVSEFSGDIVSKQINETSDYILESYGGRLNRAAHFSQIFDGQAPETIVENIIDNQVPTLTYASTATSGITIDRFVIRDETPGEAIGRLVKLLNWQIRTDNDKNFYFEPIGTTINSTPIVIRNNAYLKTTWSETPNSLVNSVVLIGGDAVFNTAQSFTATASQTVFTVDEKIIGNVKVTDNGTEMVGGTSDSITTYDYEVDFDNRIITFTVGRTAGHTIIVNYDYGVPIKIDSKNDPSISSNTIFSRKVTDATIKTMADARKRVKKIINDGKITKNAEIGILYNSTYQVGETVQVTDTFNDVDQQVVINKLTFNYLEGEKIIEVGNAKNNLLDWNKGLDERLKALESKQDNSDRIQKYIQIPEKINMVQRVGRIRVRSHPLGNAWIVGSSTNGLVGTNTATQGGGQQVVGAGGRGTATVTSVQNPNDTFYERFNFTTYIDATNSNATYGTGSAYFSSGSAMQSLEGYKGTTNVSKATINVTQTGTPLTLYMSTTGTAGFESVTDGTQHTFGTASTELRWKAEASSGTAKLTKVKITYE